MMLDPGEIQIKAIASFLAAGETDKSTRKASQGAKCQDWRGG